MKTLKTHVFMLLCLLGIATQQAAASHYMGAEMTYTCNPTGATTAPGTCTYRIYIKMYYDCAGSPANPLPGPPPDPGTMTFTAIGTGASPMPTLIGGWVFVSYLETTPVCPSAQTQCTNLAANVNGVLESVFYQDINFCNSATNPNSAYRVSWETCCRNNAITSIQNPGGNGIATNTIIRPGLSGCNSSPIFAQSAVPYLCAGLPISINYAAYDPDGDSLVYSLIKPYDIGAVPVSYSIGYSATQPMGPSWNVSINSQTGDISIVPNPGNPVVGVLCVGVDEYRNGVLIGQTRRDVQLTVIAGCQSMSAPVIDTALVINGIQKPNNHIAAFVNKPLTLVVSAADMDTSQVLSATLYNPPAGATISYTGINPITATITWTPTAADVGKVLPLSLKVADGNCPLPAIDMAHWIITVNPAYLSAITTGTNCGASNGAIDLTHGGFTPPVHFLWNTGDTTEDLTGIPSGAYSVTVTDSVGKTLTDSFVVQGLNLNVALDSGWVNCALNGGWLKAHTLGGTPPIAYKWLTGATTDSISGLTAGLYTVVAKDSTGCTRKIAYTLHRPDTCVVTIDGILFLDQNQNCVQDAGEPPIPYAYLNVSPGGAVFTDAQGAYHIEVDTGAYSLALTPPKFGITPCVSQQTMFFNFNSYTSDTAGVNFPVYMQQLQDLKLKTHVGSINPGFHKYAHLYWENVGSLPVPNTQLSWTHAAGLTPVTYSVPPTTYSPLTRTATWNIGTAGVAAKGGIWIDIYPSITLTIGDTLPFAATILPIVGDTVPQNNSVFDTVIVTASYDPNRKSVSPRGEGAAGYIAGTTPALDYTIEFQNTGNDTAQFVILRDTIDISAVDISGYTHGTSSHPYTLRVEADSILVFRFDNILLVDSATNEAASQGHVDFSLPMKQGLPYGKEIRNRAAIYFDYNAPIITNEVLNTLCYAPIADFDTTQFNVFFWTPALTGQHYSSFQWNIVGDTLLPPNTPLAVTGANLQDIWKHGNGLYTIQLVVNNPCGSDATAWTTDVFIESIDAQFAQRVRLAPNPAAAKTLLTFPNETAEAFTLRVYDITGRVVRTYENLRSNSLEILRGDLPAGVYALDLNGASAHWSGRVVWE